MRETHTAAGWRTRVWIILPESRGGLFESSLSFDGEQGFKPSSSSSSSSPSFSCSSFIGLKLGEPRSSCSLLSSSSPADSSSASSVRSRTELLGTPSQSHRFLFRSVIFTTTIASTTPSPRRATSSCRTKTILVSAYLLWSPSAPNIRFNLQMSFCRLHNQTAQAKLTVHVY